MRTYAWYVVWLGGFWLFGSASARGQLDFEGPPIHYGAKASHDRVARLAEAMEKEGVRLAQDDRWGLLPALLEALEIPVDSQTLVFSKTSFQIHKINPERPRAIYFNDDTYVGWVRDSQVLEIGSVDREQGAVFYTLEPSRGEFKIVRDQGQCLICHGNQRTQGVPGFLVRSVYCNPSGHFVSGTPTFVTDHASPFEQRWGGWYVTGTHGSMSHLGNVVCQDESTPGWLDPQAGLNRQSLPSSIAPDRYLTSTSDIVALMVLEHQTQMHNMITRAGFEARTAAYQDEGINEAMERPHDYQSESTARRIANVGERLVRYLLFADEFPLTSPVTGNSSFSKNFSARGPRDSQGRSLYQLDLQHRLFQYPCSFLIYSEAFDRLPAVVHSYVGKRLHAILLSETPEAEYDHLSTTDRTNVASILKETKKEFWERYVMVVNADKVVGSGHKNTAGMAGFRATTSAP